MKTMASGEAFRRSFIGLGSVEGLRNANLRGEKARKNLVGDVRGGSYL